jgi:shikimate dehydrogenase
VRRIRGTTRVVAILGDPVEHSRSPAMHNAAFATLGLDYVYVPLRVAAADLARALGGVRALGLAGLNVTVPHKQRILPLLDRLSASAAAIGAVNTVVRDGDDLVGHNTDADGFLRALAKLGFRPRGKAVVLLGAGGSARAAAWALARSRVGRLTILNRNVARAGVLARKLSGAGRVEVGSLAAAEHAETIGEADLIVNCTTLGLDGVSAPAVAIRLTRESCLFYDLVYGAHPTPFVRAARRQRRRASDGLGMLLEQAGLAFRLWTGRKPPLEAMARALRD